MSDKDKLRELADQLICHPVSRSITEIEEAGEAIKRLLDELKSLREAIEADRAHRVRKPLTSAEIADLWDGTLFHITDLSTATDFVRDVEAAHGIAASPKPKD